MILLCVKDAKVCFAESWHLRCTEVSNIRVTCWSGCSSVSALILTVFLLLKVDCKHEVLLYLVHHTIPRHYGLT